MKKLSLLLISLMMLSLVACGNKTEEKDEQNPLGNPIENPLLNGDDSKDEVEVNEDFEEVVLVSGENYIISVVDMKYEDDEYTIYIAVNNQTNSDIYLTVLDVAVNNLMCFDYDWDDDNFPAGEKTITELELNGKQLKNIGVTEDMLKVDIGTVSKINNVVNYGYMTYFPNGEDAANNITTATQIDGTVIFENEYYKIGYKGYLDRGDSAIGDISLGDILILNVQNKTDKFIEIGNNRVFTVNDSDITDGCMYNGYLFPNGTYEQRLYFNQTSFETGMKLSAQFYFEDAATQTTLSEDIITIVIE